MHFHVNGAIGGETRPKRKSASSYMWMGGRGYSHGGLRGQNPRHADPKGPCSSSSPEAGRLPWRPEFYPTHLGTASVQTTEGSGLVHTWQSRPRSASITPQSPTTPHAKKPHCGVDTYVFRQTWGASILSQTTTNAITQKPTRCLTRYAHARAAGICSPRPARYLPARPGRGRGRHAGFASSGDAQRPPASPQPTRGRSGPRPPEPHRHGRNRSPAGRDGANTG